MNFIFRKSSQLNLAEFKKAINLKRRAITEHSYVFWKLFSRNNTMKYEKVLNRNLAEEMNSLQTL